MKRATEYEALNIFMQMRSEAHAARPGHTDSVADTQKKRANSSASKETTHRSGTADSAKPVAKRPKKDKRPVAAGPIHAHPEAGVPKATLNEVPQHADRIDLRSPVLSNQELADIKAKALLSIIDHVTGKRYPNVHYRRLKKRGCEANMLCYFCFQPTPGANPVKRCPSPAFKQ